MGESQTGAQSTKTAHGEAADKGVLYLGGQAEGLPGIVQNFVTYKGGVFLAGCFLVQVEAVSAVGHNDRQIILNRQFLNAAARNPVIGAAVVTVEQNQRFHRTLVVGVRICHERGDIIWENQIERVLSGQCRGEVSSANQCHVVLLLCIFLIPIIRQFPGRVFYYLSNLFRICVIYNVLQEVVSLV